MVAAPVGGQVLSEVLPYMELTKDNETEERKQIEVPDIEGMTIKEATKRLKECNLLLKIQNEPESLDKSNTNIVEQLPKSGINVYEGTEILVTL